MRGPLRCARPGGAPRVRRAAAVPAAPSPLPARSRLYGARADGRSQLLTCGWTGPRWQWAPRRAGGSRCGPRAPRYRGRQPRSARRPAAAGHRARPRRAATAARLSAYLHTGIW